MDVATMRFALVVFAALVASPAAFAGDARLSQSECDASKIGARDLADCLRTNSDRADHDLAAVVDAAIKNIEARPGVLNAQKARWKRSLNDAQTQWLSWRDAECQDVAPFEAGMSAKGGDPRLACIIDRDAERGADLKARYP
jgi:uncharacterized protein YecT (DUF1311 family)